jgi:hypothetical protein
MTVLVFSVATPLGLVGRYQCFHPEHGGSMLLQNVCSMSTEISIWRYYPEDQYLYLYSHLNIKCLMMNCLINIILNTRLPPMSAPLSLFNGTFRYIRLLISYVHAPCVRISPHYSLIYFNTILTRTPHLKSGHFLSGF